MEYERILDYIIDQSNKYDARNLQYEEDVLFQIRRAWSRTVDKIVSTSSGYVNMNEMYDIISRVEGILNVFYHTVTILLNNKFKEYYKIGYDQTNDLLELGNELDTKFRRISEIKTIHDENSIGFIRDHAFDLMKGYTEQLKSKIRAELGDLLLKGNTDKASVRAHIEKSFGVNRSKAEEIAQHELSRAYNYGVLSRLESYEAETGRTPRKYWHGFLHSDKTCTYCRPRIGHVYDLHDNIETLPAHVRCRCVWLPVLEGWDKPTNLVSRANMLNTGYSSQQMYDRINNRLGIRYGQYLDADSVNKYLGGDRSPNIMKSLSIARDTAAHKEKESFNIMQDRSNSRMSNEYNAQMSFWKDMVAGAIVDNDNDLLSRSVEAIKGVMVLPWNGEQLGGWNELLNIINKYL